MTTPAHRQSGSPGDPRPARRRRRRHRPGTRREATPSGPQGAEPGRPPAGAHYAGQVASPTVDAADAGSGPAGTPAQRDRILRWWSALIVQTAGPGPRRGAGGGLAVYAAFAPSTWWWMAIVGFAPVRPRRARAPLAGRARSRPGLRSALYLPLLVWTNVYVGDVPWVALAVAEALLTAPAGALVAAATPAAAVLAGLGRGGVDHRGGAARALPVRRLPVGRRRVHPARRAAAAGRRAARRGRAVVPDRARRLRAGRSSGCCAVAACGRRGASSPPRRRRSPAPLLIGLLGLRRRAARHRRHRSARSPSSRATCPSLAWSSTPSVARCSTCTPHGPTSWPPRCGPAPPRSRTW